MESAKGGNCLFANGHHEANMHAISGPNNSSRSLCVEGACPAYALCSSSSQCRHLDGMLTLACDALSAGLYSLPQQTSLHSPPDWTPCFHLRRT